MPWWRRPTARMTPTMPPPTMATASVVSSGLAGSPPLPLVAGGWDAVSLMFSQRLHLSCDVLQTLISTWRPEDVSHGYHARRFGIFTIFTRLLALSRTSPTGGGLEVGAGSGLGVHPDF